MNIPRWAWWVIGILIILVLFVILKVNISIGPGGFSITQGLVH